MRQAVCVAPASAEAAVRARVRRAASGHRRGGPARQGDVRDTGATVPPDAAHDGETMPTLYFHAGMNKTGSSAVQSYFQRNRKLLGQAGLAYPSLPSPNHSSFLQSQFGPRRHELAQQIIGRLVASEADLDAFRTAFDGFLATSARAGRDVLLSAEATMKLQQEGYRELRDLALASFDRVVAVALVRPPLSFARSAMQQRLKGGLSVGRFDELPPTPDYARRFGPLIEVFGADNVRLRIYHPATFVAGDVLQTILAMLDGDRSALRDERAPRSNVSVSMTACKALALISGVLHAGGVGPQVPPPLAARLTAGALGAFFATTRARRVRQLPPHINGVVLGIAGGGFRLPHALGADLLARSADDIAWMSQRLDTDLLAHDEPLPPAGSDPFAEWSEPEIAAVAEAFDRINAQDDATIAALAERRLERKATRSQKALTHALAPQRPARRREPK